MEQLEIKLVHSGQDRRYGDYYYRYEITTQESMNELVKFIERGEY